LGCKLFVGTYDRTKMKSQGQATGRKKAAGKMRFPAAIYYCYSLSMEKLVF
jgi:hypothetical protein